MAAANKEGVHYTVTVEFDTGTESREVIWHHDFDEQAIFLFALADMRMISKYPGAGWDGKVQKWDVREMINTGENK